MISTIKNLAFGLILGSIIFNINSVETKNKPGFIFFTTLYNEKDIDRICEFIICLESNLKHSMLKKIHILYDYSKDDNNCLLLNYLKNKKITIDYINKRPTYEDFFNISNSLYEKSKIIIANADIFFDESLNLLQNYDLKNTFIGLTRWDLKKNGTTTLFMNYSQDSWIFQAPIKKIKSDFPLGILGCENALMDYIISNKFIAINPCYSIKSYHLHLSAIRNYSKDYHIKTRPGYKAIPHNYLAKRNVQPKASLELLAYNYAKKNNLLNLVNLMLELAISAELKNIGWPISVITKENVDKIHAGKTALHFAIINEHLTLINLLIDFGANCLLKNDLGLSALDYAKQTNNTKLIDTLINNVQKY